MSKDEPKEDMTREQLAMLQANTHVLVIDVRPSAEFAGGHVLGEVNIPSSELLTRVPENVELVTVCARGGTRCHDAAAHLRSAGYKARALTGGALAWLEAEQAKSRVDA